MIFIVYFMLLLFSGLAGGVLARRALPRPDSMTVPQLILVSAGSSVLAGIVCAMLFRGLASLLLGSILSAAIVYRIRRSRGDSVTVPGAPPPRPATHSFLEIVFAGGAILWGLLSTGFVIAVIVVFLWGGSKSAHAHCLAHRLGGSNSFQDNVACLVEH